MTTFVEFRDIVNQKIVNMTVGGTPVFRTHISPDSLWDIYLNSFPEGTNKMYRERREYDCTCCAKFIRDVGNMVIIDNNLELVSVWDIQVGGYYQPVVDAMAKAVKQYAIADHFLSPFANIGAAQNFELIEGGQKQWDHFHTKLHTRLVKAEDKIPTYLNERRNDFNMLLRSLNEFTIEAIDIVDDLIEQNTLTRAEQKAHLVKKLKATKLNFDAFDDVELRIRYCWLKSVELGKEGRFRGDVIGTLIEDLSQGVELEDAIKKYDFKVEGPNYQRTTAPISKRQIQAAQQKIQELGMTDSLERRFAVANDISVNNVLFVDRQVRAVMKNGFDSLMDDVKPSSVNMDKVEKISIADFMSKVLPTAQTLEVMFGNNHKNNLVSLIAPVHDDAPGMFSWDNKFSWSYNGEVTDAIKERVKKAGGKVDGDVRLSLAWHNPDDLDLHVYEPNTNHIYFARRERVSPYTGGNLDVDMNGMDEHDHVNPVENVVWPNMKRMLKGVYTVVVNQYDRRDMSTDAAGFTLEFDVKGKVMQFTYDKPQKSKESVTVLKFEYDGKDIKLVESIAQKPMSTEHWGIETGKFHKVSMVMNSPNYWDGQANGHKHVFFVIGDCKNPDPARGFYNEFLKAELKEHRKVFEQLAGKMKAQPTDEQLSGLGFATSTRNTVYVKVGGSFNRVLEVMF